MAGKKTDVLPIESRGNGSNIRTLEFDIGDIAMLAHGLAIARNTVMMCAGGKATARMNYYYEKLRELCPPGARHLNRDEDLSNIVIAMADSDEWSIWKIKKYSSDKTARARIKVGDQVWTTWTIDTDAHQEIIECIEAVSPITCNRIDAEDEIEKRW